MEVAKDRSDGACGRGYHHPIGPTKSDRTRPEYAILLLSEGKALSRLSFKSFCIEFYARHIGSTGADVYRMFSQSGLLKTLDDDYEDLHGLGWEALMPMFDEYLGRTPK